MERRIGSSVARGAVAGAVATTAMSEVLLAAQRAGLIRKLPPERVTGRVLDALHVRRSRREQKAITTVAHYGFGMLAGSAFDLIRGRLAPRHPVAEGAVYGGLVWGLSYAGWLPALNILPPAHRDRRGQQVALVLAHAVFGGVLGWLASKLAP